MSGVTPEEIKKAREIDLLSYLQEQEPEEIVSLGHGNYTTRTHDSLKISNGAWMWFSRGFGGYSALDYLVKVREIDFVEAVKILNRQIPAYQSVPCNYRLKEKEKKLLLPERNNSQNRVIRYLCGRGIDREIIQYCVDRHMIYEEKIYGNVVFVGYDEENRPRYAAFRATGGVRILGEAAGSDKRYCFKLLNPISTELHLFEGAIDLLSYATIEKLKGNDWRKESLVSLAGVYRPKTDGSSKIPVALQKVLAENEGIQTVCLHFDNDMPGKTAAAGIENSLRGIVKVSKEPPPCGKDYNDYLCSVLGIMRGEERKNERKNGKER